MNEKRIRMLAHNVRSLWNVGSFFRTCDAFAVERLYLTGYTGTPPRKEITKTAIGAEDFVSWETTRDPVALLKGLREDGWQLLGLELTPEAENLSTYSAGDNVCLIVGHELTGIPPDILMLCHSVVKIPMLGHKESLNVAVAAGIALHHLRVS